MQNSSFLKPSLYIFAGINGAGKTTLYYKELENGTDLGRRINIDEIVQAIGDWKNPSDQTRASKIALKHRTLCLENLYTFNIETTLSGKGILALVKKALQLNYDVNLFYVGLENSELAKDRVAIRMLKGGHFVDNKTIDRRYPKSMKNLFKVLPLAKNVFIYDNSNNFKLIAQKKENQELEVLEHIAWFDNLLKELS